MLHAIPQLSFCLDHSQMQTIMEVGGLKSPQFQFLISYACVNQTDIDTEVLLYAMFNTVMQNI